MLYKGLPKRRHAVPAAPGRMARLAGRAKDFLRIRLLRVLDTGVVRIMQGFCGVLAAPGAILYSLFVILLLPAAAPASDTQALDLALDLDAYRGNVVVVDFWASWCVPCRRSFPWLDEMQQKYAADGLVVIGVNEDDAAADADAFLRSFPVSFQIVRDADGALAREFDLVAMPSTYVIDRNGEIATRHLGFKTGSKDEYEATLRRLLSDDVTASD